MAVTEPANLAYPGRNGDVPETAITNAAASEKGFPARTQEGNLVFIVKTEREGLQKVLVDADGNRYVDNGPSGTLVLFTTEELTDEDFETTMSRFGASPPEPNVESHQLPNGEWTFEPPAETAAEVEAAAAGLTGNDTVALDNGDDLSSAA